MSFFSSLVKSLSASMALALMLVSSAMAETPPANTLSIGVVKKIDLELGKITISHGPLANLDMPAMTMVFRVVDPKLLTQAKVNDSIRFEAEKINGAYTVLRIEQEN